MVAVRRLALWGAFAFFTSAFLSAAPAQAQVTAFMQSVAEAAASDRDIAAFYKANGYKPIWTGKGNADKARRAALLRAIADAPAHGLPAGAYNSDTLKVNLRSVRSERDLGKLEVEMSRIFLAYARDVQTGVLTPSQVDGDIFAQTSLAAQVFQGSGQAVCQAFKHRWVSLMRKGGIITA